MPRKTGIFLSPEDRAKLDISRRSNILQLLDDGWTVKEICKQLHVGTNLVCKVKKLYLDQGLSAALGIREYQPIHPYVLGILWAIGSYNSDNVFFVRHSDPYFLEVIKKATSTPASVRKVGRNYVLKLSESYFKIQKLRELGWAERNNQDRPYPDINEHQDFIRGYFEIHGRVSEVKLHNRKSGRIQSQIRLRIFGNETLIQSINDVISFEIGIQERKLENTQKEHSKVLGYYKTEDITEILNWLYHDTSEYRNSSLERKYYEIINTKL